MALSLESAGLVRQKAREFSQSPLIFYSLKAFFHHHAQFNNNSDLQFLPINGTDIDAAGGQDHAIDAACRVYFVYLKKAATATDTFYVLFDDATNDAGAETDARVQLALLESAEEAIAVYPKGLVMAAGLVSKGYSDGYTNATDASEADTPNGFLIVGAS